MITGEGAVRILVARGSFTAVIGWRARVGQDDGAVQLPEARAILRDLRHDGARSELIALHELVSGVGVSMPSRVASLQLVSRIEAAIEAGRLLFFRGWGSSAGVVAAAEARATEGGAAATLVRELMGRRGQLRFEGRRYRLVPASSVAGVGVAGGYRPVPPEDASALVDRMAERLATRPDVRERWSRVAALLASDDEEERLTLLLYAPAGGASQTDEAGPAETPSQIQKELAPEHWIELELVYDDGTPYDGRCVLELPGGRTVDGAPDEDGLVRVDGLRDAGTCKVSFPDLDVAALG
jgi:hypothetical protein